MKNSLCLCLVLVMALAMAATARKIDPRANLVTKDGDAPAVKVSGAKLPSIGTIINATGYADAWRATAGMAGKSIVVDPTGAKIGIAFGVAASGTNCDMLFGYSLDGGATWGTQTIASGMNARIYNGIAFDASGVPYICWQDRTNNSIQWAKDEGGVGAGLWTTPDTLACDSVAWYLPTMAIRDSILIISAFAHALVSPAGDFSSYYALSYDLGSTWVDIDGGWTPWSYNELLGKGYDVDATDWLISGSGDIVIGYLEVVDANGAFIPAYKISTDSGLTFGTMQFFSLPPQYNAGGWWYMYDGAWIGDRPYLLYTHQDGVWNGAALFVYFPTVAGDYSAWTLKRISDIPGNLAGVTPGDLNGGEANFPTLSYDVAGNIFAIYADYPKDGDSFEFFGVASTDKGNTWLNPVRLTNEAGELDGNIYLEAAEFAGGDKIHMLFHDLAYTNIYYWSVPTSTILAGGVRPEEITLAPELCGSSEGGWGGPIDAVMDTVQSLGDTLTTYWAPKVAMGGTYDIELCRSADFFSSTLWINYDAWHNVNYLTTIGLPETNVVWYWRARAVKNDSLSPWSVAYDFYYKGNTVNYYDWYRPGGIEGNATEYIKHNFVLNQNRPNPVNKLAELSFTLPRSGSYSLKIYNIAGQVIRNLDGRGNAGQNTVTWNGLDNGGRKAANGVYLYNLQAFGNSATRKMIILR